MLCLKRDTSVGTLTWNKLRALCTYCSSAQMFKRCLKSNTAATHLLEMKVTAVHRCFSINR